MLPSNKTAEIAFMKEDYIECRCQLLKANPTLAESFSETTGKVTLRLASIYFKIPNDQKWNKPGTNINLRGVEVVTSCPNYLPSLCNEILSAIGLLIRYFYQSDLVRAKNGVYVLNKVKNGPNSPWNKGIKIEFLDHKYPLPP